MAINRNNTATEPDRVLVAPGVPRWITDAKTLKALRHAAHLKENGLLMEMARLERRIGEIATERDTQREQAFTLLKALVIGWDADDEDQFSAALAHARDVLGFKLAPGKGRRG